MEQKRRKGRKKQEKLVLFPEVYTNAVKMTDAQFGVLMRAVFAYRFEGRIYEGDDLAIDVSFRTVAGQIDRYAEICETNSNNAKGEEEDGTTESSEIQGNAAESPKGQQNAPPIPTPIPDPSPNSSKGNTAEKPPSRHRFTPPTVEEVIAYCTEKGYTVDPQRFVNYYTSVGWRVGKNPMKDWKAAVRTWNGKEQSQNGKAEPKSLWTVGTTV